MRYRPRHGKVSKSKIPGRSLEMLVERGIDDLNRTFPKLFLGHRLGVPFVLSKEGKPIRTTKQPGDFVIFTPGQAWLFDTKECGKKKWYPPKSVKRQIHQYYSLKALKEMGHRAGFVVWFKASAPLELAIALKAIRFVEDFEKPITVTDGIPFDWTIFLPGVL